MARRSRCIICGKLTAAARYVELLWPWGGVIQAPWYGRRVCDACAPVGPELVVRVGQVRFAKSPPHMPPDEF
jgi:hypothetical protein